MLSCGVIASARRRIVARRETDFAFISRSAPAIAQQGVAFDGTHVYETGGIDQDLDEQWLLYKYDLTESIVATRNVGADGDALHTQINGLYYNPDDDLIYASATNFLQSEGSSQSNPRSWVLVYDTSLNFISSTELQPVIGEQLWLWNGSWWQVAWNVHQILRYDTSFTFVAAYNLPDTSPGIPLWQGIFVIDDVFYLNLHTDNSDANPLRAYTWNGSGFAAEAITVTRPTIYTSQGNYFDGENIWWAERVIVGDDVTPGLAHVVKTRAFPAAADLTPSADGAVLLTGDMQSGTDRLLLTGDEQAGADAELESIGV